MKHRLGLALLLAALAALSSCEIVAISPFPMTVALADRMVNVKAIMHGFGNFDTRLTLLKNGQLLAITEGQDHLTIFDRDLNLMYKDSNPGQYGQNMRVVDVALGDLYIGSRVINSSFTTNNPHGFAAEWFYYYSTGPTYYGIRLNGGLLELSNGPSIGGLGAGALYGAPFGWELNRVFTDATNGKVSLIFREPGGKDNIPHIVVMSLANAIAGANPFTVGIQKGLDPTESDKTFMIRGGFVSHAYNNAKAINLDLTDRKTIYDTALSRMALTYSPDSDRFYVYDGDAGYLYRCKPWW
jgi:hypothetical protein